MKRLFCFACIVLLIIISIPAMAQQSNFMISPPPIPWFEFKEGQKDLRVTATGLYLTGDSAAPLTGDIKIWGAGGGM